MKSYRRGSIDSYLQQVRLGIENAQAVPEIADALTVYGYGTDRFVTGSALLSTAESLEAVQKKEYGEQYKATESLRAAWDAADKVYSTYRKLTKLALRDDKKMLATMLVDQAKARTLSAWLKQAMVFYENALSQPEVLAALATYNITAEMLTAGQTAALAIVPLEAAQEREKMDAQKATKSRNAALDELDYWYTEFRDLARIALAEDQQRLEALGLGTVA